MIVRIGTSVASGAEPTTCAAIRLAITLPVLVPCPGVSSGNHQRLISGSRASSSSSRMSRSRVRFNGVGRRSRDVACSPYRCGRRAMPAPRDAPPGAGGVDQACGARTACRLHSGELVDSAAAAASAGRSSTKAAGGSRYALLGRSGSTVAPIRSPRPRASSYASDASGKAGDAGTAPDGDEEASEVATAVCARTGGDLPAGAERAAGRPVAELAQRAPRCPAEPRSAVAASCRPRRSSHPCPCRGRAGAVVGPACGSAPGRGPIPAPVRPTGLDVGMAVDSEPRRLVLLRHGKSAYPQGVPDHERPLAERGERQAGSRRGLDPRRACRPWTGCCARRRTRTRQTLAATGIAAPTTFTDAIYGAYPDELLDLVRELPDGDRIVLLIGHAPGLPDLAEDLAGPDRTRTRSRRSAPSSRRRRSP